jgi:hypothetical protein
MCCLADITVKASDSSEHFALQDNDEKNQCIQHDEESSRTHTQKDMSGTV